MARNEELCEAGVPRHAAPCCTALLHITDLPTDLHVCPTPRRMSQVMHRQNAAIAAMNKELHIIDDTQAGPPARAAPPCAAAPRVPLCFADQMAERPALPPRPPQPPASTPTSARVYVVPRPRHTTYRNMHRACRTMSRRLISAHAPLSSCAGRNSWLVPRST